MSKPRFTHTLITLLCIALIWTACTPSSTGQQDQPTSMAPVGTEVTAVTEVPAVTEAASQNKNDLTFGIWGKTSAVNFCTLRLAMGNEEIWRNRFVGATLMTIDKNNEIIPSLATTFSINDDATVFTFTLNGKAIWHDGAPFTSQDVKFTFDLLLNPDLSDFNPFFRGLVDKVEAIDDYTVTFYLIHPINPGDFRTKSALWNLLQGWIPVPKHILDGTDPSRICESSWAVDKYVGLGPFQVAEYQPDDHVIYVPFKDYHLGASQLDFVRMNFSTNPSILLDDLKAGKLNLAQTTPELINQIISDPNLLLPADASLLAVNKNLMDWPPPDPYLYSAVVEADKETFVPYREGIDEPVDIGNASLLPQKPEMRAAIDSLDKVTNVKFNISRTVTILDEGVTVYWTPIGPENAPRVNTVEDFWQFVKDIGGLNIGVVVIADVPYSAWAYVTDNGREIWLLEANGETVKRFTESEIKYGLAAAPVEVPIAGIDIGTRWCRGQAFGVYFSYPCGW